MCLGGNPDTIVCLSPCILVQPQVKSCNKIQLNTLQIQEFLACAVSVRSPASTLANPQLIANSSKNVRFGCERKPYNDLDLLIRVLRVRSPE